MTTITYRDGILAADSIALNGDILLGRVHKIHAGRGYLLGYAGLLSTCQAYHYWLDDNISTCGLDATLRKTPLDDLKNKVEDINMTALLVTTGGKVWRSRKLGTLLMVEAPFHAIGSGSELALGAMAHGASATEAVDIALTLDTSSIGPVISLKLEDILNN